jgi:hypothetical protein
MLYKGRSITSRRLLASIKYRVEDLLFNRLFEFWELLGFHITKKHYYEPIPDMKSLDDSLWDKKLKLVGISMNEEEQIDLLHSLSLRYREEYEEIPRGSVDAPSRYYINNGSFESVDGEILYCFIRHFRPSRIIEIGSGQSTCLSAEAITVNREEDPDYQCKLISIDPYPDKLLLSRLKGVGVQVQKGVQNVPLSFFSCLEENDILFIDSSHILKIGSDVQYEYLEIIPELKKGVLIHVHDIFLPFEYPKEQALEAHRFYNEQYLLQAFLSFNNEFKIIWAGYNMHTKYPNELEKAFSSYSRESRWPGSFWIKRI